MTYHDGQLWTAQFNGDGKTSIYTYDVGDDGSVSAAPSSVMGGEQEMQGIAVNDDYVYVSQSEGRHADHSTLTRIDRVTGERESIEVPSNMAEGIALHGNQLVQTYESGAAQYAERRRTAVDDHGARPRLTRPARQGGRVRQTTEPVSFSPGPWPGGSWITEASRNASWSDFSPSRRGAACWLPRSGALAVTSPASAVISRRASSRSRCSAASGPSASPHLTAAALIRWIAAVVMTSTAGTSAMSRVACS